MLVSPSVPASLFLHLPCHFWNILNAETFLNGFGIEIILLLCWEISEAWVFGGGPLQEVDYNQLSKSSQRENTPIPVVTSLCLIFADFSFFPWMETVSPAWAHRAHDYTSSTGGTLPCSRFLTPQSPLSILDFYSTIHFVTFCVVIYLLHCSLLPVIYISYICSLLLIPSAYTMQEIMHFKRLEMHWLKEYRAEMTWLLKCIWHTLSSCWLQDRNQSEHLPQCSES